MSGLNISWKDFKGTPKVGRALLLGSFDCNGSSDPADPQGDIARFYTITHDATGTYLLTPTVTGEKPAEIEDAQAEFLGDVTPGDDVAVQAIDADTGVITIKTYDVADTDIPSGEAIRVQVRLWVRTIKSDDDLV